MKKVIAALVVLGTAAPTLADVVISCSPGPGPKDVTISFDATSEVDSVRAFALDLVACDYNIVEVNCISDDYYVYVGSISIDSGGQVTDWGSCVCSSSYPGTLGGLDTNGVTIEMISLYAGEANAPSSQGDLVTVTLSCCDDCSVEVSENAIRGGVVMEDPNQIVTVTIVGCHCPPPPPPGRCWDSSKCGGQRSGDGTCDGSINLADLFALKAAFGKSAPWSGSECCSDYNQDQSVNLGDLFILKAGFGSSGYFPSTGSQICP